jgi:LysR family nitrogen assimilation transcriptional regulator
MEERLKKFAGIVDAGNFTKAASVLHVSQPALTLAVKKLERELKAELLVRGSQTCAPTPAGRIAYAAAKELHALGSNLKLRLSDLAGQKAPLKLGAIDAMAALLFIEDEYLHVLEEQTHLSLSINNSEQLLQLVSTDALDLAIIAAPHLPGGGLTLQHIGIEPLVFVCRPDHALHATQQLHEGKVGNFLAYNQNSQSFKLIAAHFSRLHIHLEPTFYSTSPEIMLRLVLAGRGIAVLPYALVAGAISEAQLLPLATGNSPLINRAIVAVHRTGRLLPDQATDLMQHATRRLQTLYTQAEAAL